jgi:hypothetical protein
VVSGRRLGTILVRSERDGGDADMAEHVRFRGSIRFFRPERAGGLAVVDIPAEATAVLGGLKQMRVRGLLNGTEFTSNTMPAGGGVLALSVSRKMLRASGLEVGDEAEFEIARIDATG